MVSASQAQFDTAAAWGDADPTGSNGTQGGAPDTGTASNGNQSGTFTADGTTVTITSGGFDFWTANDGGTFVYDSGGAYTTTGDFTASVRHVDVDADNAANWGRSVISARATQAPGTVAFNDAHMMVMRRSNGFGVTGWRDTAGAGTGRDDGAFPQPDLGTVSGANAVPAYMALGREGNTIRTAFARDIGGVAGRWVEHGNRAQPAWAAGNELVVGLGHQAHNEAGNTAGTPAGPTGGGEGRVNTATFDNWMYSSSFDPSFFGPAQGQGGNPWQLGGNLAVDPTSGAVTGSAYVSEGGSATGEVVAWTLNASKILGVQPNLTADIYLAGNPGNQAGARGIIGGVPDGTAIIETIDWTGGSDNDANYNGLTGPESFGVAVQGIDPANNTAGAFSGNQESYGVHMTGDIFIPADADRQPGNDGNINTIAFKDGIDDYTFLGIDGVTLVDDNSWTGFDGSANGGSPIVQLDVSDPKYDDGEWVSFEMISWEGGGGDAGALYWDINAAGGFPATQTDAASPTALIPPGSFRHYEVGDAVSASGFTQVGSESSNGPFGLVLSPGDWEVSLLVENTGASASFFSAVTVTGDTFQITEIVYNQGADTVDLTWNSFPGANYLLESSPDLENWTEVDDSVPAGPGSTTTLTDIPVDPPGSKTMNYRVVLGTGG